MKVAVVGATGLVGRKMLQVLEERNFPVTELIPVASERSVMMNVICWTFLFVKMRLRVSVRTSDGRPSGLWD